MAIERGVGADVSVSSWIPGFLCGFWRQAGELCGRLSVFHRRERLLSRLRAT